MTRRQISISLPAELVDRIEAESKRRTRSRSALVREAVEWYLARGRLIAVVEPTPEERAAIAEAETDLERGDYVTLEEWRRDVGLDPR
jgi:metal-responsive CopG/Arc/MetJ family transcriptional regulator